MAEEDPKQAQGRPEKTTSPEWEKSEDYRKDFFYKMKLRMGNKIDRIFLART